MAATLVGEYRLEKPLGRGSEGDVYSALSTKTNRRVVLKLLRRLRPSDDVLAGLHNLKDRSPACCAAVLDAFVHDGRVAVVLEAIEGASLRDFVSADPITPQQKAQLVLDVLKAVKTLHDAGLVHGDLSPDNVFITSAGEIKLIDPRIVTKQPGDAILGTANFAAPEMLASQSTPTRAADVFSACALAYWIFEGRTAFGCESSEEYVLKAGTNSLAPSAFDSTPAQFQKALISGLRLDPRARLGTVSGLIELIDAARTGKRRALSISMVLLVLIGVGVGGHFYHQTTSDSIAVLPFTDENHDPDTEYLSDGITESIINGLAQIPQLRVSPRNAVFQYKGSAFNPVKVARELGVRTVVTGRVRRHNERLIVSVEVFDALDKRQLWGEHYDSEVTSALHIQRDIARKIAQSLKAAKFSGYPHVLARHGTDVPEAYQAYLKGRYFWNRRTASNLKKALREFQNAVAADPSYALPYIGLADSYALMSQYSGTSTSETLPRARAAALRALEIDPSMAEAHTSLGYIEMMSWNFERARLEYQKALQLDPEYPLAHQWYGILLHVVGQEAAGLNESKKAQELDPLSPIIAAQICNMEVLGSADSTQNCIRALELDENFPRAHELLGWARIRQGNKSAALQELRRSVSASGSASQQLAYLGYGYALLDRPSDARNIAHELEKRYENRTAPGMYIAAIYAALGDRATAYEWLERDFRAHSGGLVYVTFFPVYDLLRRDRQYADLLRRMGLRAS